MRKRLLQYQNLQKSVSLLESQKYDLAIQFIDEILQKNKEDGLVLYNKGLIFYQQDQFIQAKEYFLKALKQDQNNNLILYNLGITHKALNELEQALSYFNLCLERNSNNTQAIIQKSETLRLKQQLTEAETLLTNYQKKDQNNLQIVLALIELKLNQKQFQEAASFLPQILSLEEFQSESLILIANSFMSVRFFDSATALLDKVLQKDVTNQDALLNKGIIQFNLDKLEEAAKYFNRTIQVNPKQAQALLYLALTYGQQGKFQQSLEIFNSLIQIDQNDASIWNNKGIIYMEIKQYDEAVQCFDSALRINPQNPLYKINKAQVLLQTNNQEGLKLLHEAKSEFNLIKDNALFTSTNIQYMDEKLQQLQQEQKDQIQESENQQIISYVDQNNISRFEQKEPQPHQRQNTQEVKSEIMYIPKEQQKKQKSFIQQSCLIQNSAEISQKENNIEGGQNQNIKKPSIIKYEQLKEFNRELEERIKKIENQIREVGLDKRAQIYEQLKQLQKTSEGLNQIAYFKAFFWTLYNYILTYNLQSTKLYAFNNNQTIETQGEKILSYVETGLAVGSKLTTPLPAVSNVISSVHSAIESLFNFYKDNKHQDRIDFITQIVNNKIINVSDLELQISVAALDLAIKKVDVIKNLEQYKPKFSKDFAHQIKTIIQRMIDSRSSLYQGGAAEIGLEDAMNCLGYFYQNGLMDEDEEFSSQIVNIVILKKHVIMKAEQVERQSCTCNIF